MRIVRGIGFFIIFLFVFGFLAMTLWNALIPDLFHGPVITYWQTLGLLLLAKIFFGNKGGRHGGWHGKHQWKGRPGPWGWSGECGPYWMKWKEEFEKMSPDEKEAWKAKMKERWKYGNWKYDWTEEKKPE